jgi:DNA (cytosine-5)-methyltransferase 1
LSAAPKRKNSTIGVIDIFAGPGGLGEGFSGFETFAGSATRPFELAVSAEMEASAHSTLRLRAFYRLLIRQEGDVPKEYFTYLEQVVKGEASSPSVHFGEGKWKALWKQAEQEALNLTLGVEKDNRTLFDRISAEKDRFDELVLIGGPPCQAYSIVGRARQTKVRGFKSKGTTKHFLYKQYLDILAEFSPAVFIMENVKGILTSKVGNNEMFEAIMRDLANPTAALSGSASAAKKDKRYVLLPIHVENDQERTPDLVVHDPTAFIIRCENHGIPQARHRVIIMGVREDLMHPNVAKVPGLAVFDNEVTIEAALEGLPKLRSGLSRQQDDPQLWLRAMNTERDRVIKILGTSSLGVSGRLRNLKPAHGLPRRATNYREGTNSFTAMLRNPRQAVVLNHETRSHMQPDLGRYMFCAAFAKEHKRSPSSEDFPKRLAPDHKNWDSGAFADRFRVQRQDRPSNTVTSHLSKDGNAFIHWDTRQCRSLSVREAARLQTFPDDYLFTGNRTQQYVQVGNAVPPMLAREIARVVWSVING